MEHQKIFMSIYLKAVCDRAAYSVGRSHPKTAHNLRPVLSMLSDLQDHKLSEIFQSSLQVA